MVWLLLEKEADIKVKTNDRWMALYKAAKGGYKAIVWLLLEKEVDLKAKINNR